MNIKEFVILIILFGFFSACEETTEISSFSPNHWEDHYIENESFLLKNDSLQNGKTYLSVYSHIYSISLKKTQNLTAMISLRNVSETDTVFISNANYYSTKGDLIRQYFKKPIFLKPLETVEIVIDEADNYGGSGANFIFDWSSNVNTPEPIFEAIMTSLRGAQGLSFTTLGKRIE